MMPLYNNQKFLAFIKARRGLLNGLVRAQRADSNAFDTNIVPLIKAEFNAPAEATLNLSKLHKAFTASGASASLSDARFIAAKGIIATNLKDVFISYVDGLNNNKSNLSQAEVKQPSHLSYFMLHYPPQENALIYNQQFRAKLETKFECFLACLYHEKKAFDKALLPFLSVTNKFDSMRDFSEAILKQYQKQASVFGATFVDTCGPGLTGFRKDAAMKLQEAQSQALFRPVFKALTQDFVKVKFKLATNKSKHKAWQKKQAEDQIKIFREAASKQAAYDAKYTNTGYPKFEYQGDTDNPFFNHKRLLDAVRLFDLAVSILAGDADEALQKQLLSLDKVKTTFDLLLDNQEKGPEEFAEEAKGLLNQLKGLSDGFTVYNTGSTKKNSLINEALNVFQRNVNQLKSAYPNLAVKEYANKKAIDHVSGLEAQAAHPVDFADGLNKNAQIAKQLQQTLTTANNTPSAARFMAAVAGTDLYTKSGGIGHDPHFLRTRATRPNFALGDAIDADGNKIANENDLALYPDVSSVVPNKLRTNAWKVQNKVRYDKGGLGHTAITQGQLALSGQQIMGFLRCIGYGFNPTNSRPKGTTPDAVIKKTAYDAAIEKAMHDTIIKDFFDKQDPNHPGLYALRDQVDLFASTLRREKLDFKKLPEQLKGVETKFKSSKIIDNLLTKFDGKKGEITARWNKVGPGYEHFKPLSSSATEARWEDCKVIFKGLLQDEYHKWCGELWEAQDTYIKRAEKSDECLAVLANYDTKIVADLKILSKNDRVSKNFVSLSDLETTPLGSATKHANYYIYEAVVWLDKMCLLAESVGVTPDASLTDITSNLKKLRGLKGDKLNEEPQKLYDVRPEVERLISEVNKGLSSNQKIGLSRFRLNIFERAHREYQFASNNMQPIAKRVNINPYAQKIRKLEQELAGGLSEKSVSQLRQDAYKTRFGRKARKAYKTAKAARSSALLDLSLFKGSRPEAVELSSVKDLSVEKKGAQPAKIGDRITPEQLEQLEQLEQFEKLKR